MEETPSSGLGMKRKASTHLEAKRKKGSNSPIRGNQLFSKNEVESPIVETPIPQNPMPTEAPREMVHRSTKNPRKQCLKLSKFLGQSRAVK